MLNLPTQYFVSTLALLRRRVVARLVCCLTLIFLVACDGPLLASYVFFSPVNGRIVIGGLPVVGECYPLVQRRFQWQRGQSDGSNGCTGWFFVPRGDIQIHHGRYLAPCGCNYSKNTGTNQCNSDADLFCS
jgi:hypothetical protein